MRDAFGGAFMLKVILVFVVIYVAFMCIALDYARAFRVKNRVINILEQYQYGSNTNTDEAVSNAIDAYLSEVHYLIPQSAGDNIISTDSKYDYCHCDGTYHNGICIEAFGNEKSHYYKVTSYIIFNLPFFGLDSFPLPVRGETRTIDVE